MRVIRVVEMGIEPRLPERGARIECMGIEPRLPERSARIECSIRPEENAEMEILAALPFFGKEGILAIAHRKANLDATDSFAVQALFRFVTELF